VSAATSTLAPRRTRVAILGGGPAGMAAAFELSASEELRRRFDVTVYQQGWRLGGKGATGRDPERGYRIEEHGLHVWMGFYRRAFRMMRRVFDAWQPAPGTPVRSIGTAFAPTHHTTLVGPTRSEDEAFDLWPLTLPPRPGLPWDDHDVAPDWKSFSAHLWRWSRDELAGPGLRGLSTSPLRHSRHALALGRLALAIARGLVADVLPHGAAGFDRIDAWDLREWLQRHGAESPAVYDAPPIRAFYHLAFACPDGMPGYGRGSMAAGASLRALIQLHTAYRGAPFWRMTAGMGDTVFAPIHQVLERWGVRFRFFHQVERLGLTADRSAIGSVRLRRQARVRGDRYRPLIEVGGQPCWPSQPLWDQLEDGEALRARLRELGTTFESTLRPAPAEPVELRAGEDFDAVVLAIPAPVHRVIASELIEADAAYRAMIEHTHSTATIAAQLWLRPALGPLGWESSPIVTALPGCMGTWGDMSEVLDAEAWPEGARPGSVAYLCEAHPDGPLRDPVTAPVYVRELVRLWGTEVLPRIWPGVADRDGRFDTSHLVSAPGDADPWAGQYFRANVEPSERYVLSLPGTTRHRLAPGGARWDNLALAGDWTRTSINGGSVEAAVESGQEAAKALIERFGAGAVERAS
jgi:uncharacterized protein with NAD-binding domain and iron-sulfur cluster